MSMTEEINYKSYMDDVERWEQNSTTDILRLFAAWNYIDTVKIANYLRNKGYKAKVCSMSHAANTLFLIDIYRKQEAL